MLNISNNSIAENLPKATLKSFNYHQLPSANRMFSLWLSSFMIIILIVFFLPWTQNIQMKGKVTTLLPGQRPQDINSAIAGRIEKWYVQEGNLVEKGDTIVFLSEVKPEYFDPQLLTRTAGQITAKEGSISSYQQKAAALDNQIDALRKEWILKKEKLKNKIQQAEFKQQSQVAALEQAKVNAEIAAFQFRRTDTLYQKGIKSLNDLEGKRLKMQETSAKLVVAQNKLSESANEIQIASLSFQTVDNEYNNKIAKAESDKFTALSTLYEAKGGLNKLQNQYENYHQRSKMYYVIAPQSGYITSAIKSGIGEMIKEGETIVTVVPNERELAAEMYVRPMDLPLINQVKEVRLVFDGWQAFIISGWADFSVGTFSGEVVAVDNIPNENSLYRILVKAKEGTPFPNLLQVGSGVQGIALLKDVPVWYEIWRQLNGFPADFYETDLRKNNSKFKPPVKAVAK